MTPLHCKTVQNWHINFSEYLLRDRTIKLKTEKEEGNMSGSRMRESKEKVSMKAGNKNFTNVSYLNSLKEKKNLLTKE